MVSLLKTPIFPTDKFRRDPTTERLKSKLQKNRKKTPKKQEKREARRKETLERLKERLRTSRSDWERLQQYNRNNQTLVVPIRTLKDIGKMTKEEAIAELEILKAEMASGRGKKRQTKKHNKRKKKRTKSKDKSKNNKRKTKRKPKRGHRGKSPKKKGGRRSRLRRRR